MRISDWSSDVCSSDLLVGPQQVAQALQGKGGVGGGVGLGRAAVEIQEVVADSREPAGCHGAVRSEERRGGKACVSTCRSRWSSAHSQKTVEILNTPHLYTHTAQQVSTTVITLV